MAKVELKQPIVEEISNLLADATAAVLVDYQGITVEKDTALRAEMRKNGVTYKVYKNTLLNIAFKGTQFEELSQNLNGSTAIAVTNGDATAPARIIANFDKKGEVIQFKGGVVSGTYYDAKGMNAIALIPSREVLLSRLLGSMQSPVGNFARVIKQIAESKAEA